jgi:hypothetical protein
LVIEGGDGWGWTRQLTDKAWQMEPLLLRNARPGGRWQDESAPEQRYLWELRTGAADWRTWLDLPERYGPWHSCLDGYVRWRRIATWTACLATPKPSVGRRGGVGVIISVDANVVRATSTRPTRASAR